MCKEDTIKVEVEGFRSLKKCSFDLKPLNVIVGKNGSGKSNIVDLFRMIGAVRNDRLRQDYLNGNPFRIERMWNCSNNEYDRVGITLTTNDHNTEIAIENVGSSRTRPRENVFSRESLKSIFPEICIFDFSETWNRSLQSMINCEAYLYFDKAPIDDTNPLGWLRRWKCEQETISSKYKQVISTVRLIYPDLEDFYFDETERVFGAIGIVKWKARGTDELLDLWMLPESVLRWTCIVVLLMSKMTHKDRAHFVVMDEADTGFDPKVLTPLAAIIRMFSKEPENKIVVTTKSVTFLNQFDVEDVIMLRHDRKDGTVTHRCDPSKYEEWLEDVPLGELWYKNILE